MQEIILKKRYFERGLSKSLKKVSCESCTLTLKKKVLSASLKAL